MNPDKTAADYLSSPLFYVDGQTPYYQEYSNEGKTLPKQLIFGLRRGGNSYYSLNVEDSAPTNWKVKWHISNTGDFAEMGQSWSKMELMKIHLSSSDNTVAGVFGGGYDTEYDNQSTIESSDSSKPGAALYVIDILNSDTAGITLLKKVAYTTDTSQESNQMAYAIPADPAVIPDKYGYLKTIYFSDLGGQVWNLEHEGYGFKDQPRLVFKANPGSNAARGAKTGGALISSDSGRRMFYSPTVTLMGSCNYRYSKQGCNYTDLDSNNNTGSEACEWVTRDPETYVLIVGTGDREHPNRKDINNRIYMILDTNEDTPLNETNLFNVTMDDTDVDNTSKSDTEKNSMRNYQSTTNGWYIKLEDINDTTDYGELVYHDGEKILAHPTVFNGAAYIPSYTPISDDECHPKGEAKIYALNYCDGTAAINFFKGNDDTSGTEVDEKFDYRDRYRTIGESLPSNPKIIIRDGKPEIFISVGGGLPTIESKFGLKPIDIINWREIRN
jgi:type IV pilus assembly protein PilY1